VGTVLPGCQRYRVRNILFFNFVSHNPIVAFPSKLITRGLVMFCRFVIDSADLTKVEAAKQELKSLLERPTLENVPLLVLGNKNDLPGALTVEGVIDALYVLVSVAAKRSYSQLATLLIVNRD
jgi:signal recognition particle receptor subunit beta